jgi:hypothetical protein
LYLPQAEHFVSHEMKIILFLLENSVIILQILPTFLIEECGD